jgi:hypothetical protein
MGGTFPMLLLTQAWPTGRKTPSRVRSYASRVNKVLGLAKVPRPSFSSSRLLVWLPQLHEYGGISRGLRPICIWQAQPTEPPNLPGPT